MSRLLGDCEETEMDEQKAREILKDALAEDGGLTNTGWYVGWTPGDSEAVLDGHFTAEQLEAVVWWMRNAPKPE